MRTITRSSLALTLGLFATTLLCQATSAQDRPASSGGDRPRVGLVLGGGGAKGAAHIGVLRVLEELRVPIDCVTGTSMGALVGATFAAGVAPVDIEGAVLAIDWSQTVGGQGQRDQTPIEHKLSGLTYSNALEFGLRDGALTAPAGIFATQAIENQIRTLVASAWLTESFDDLPIPFRAVATDMLSGSMVVLDDGPLPVAMRASMAIPGAFAPVTTDGMILADGGLMRNLPVDVARQLCADVVIAVWLSTTPPSERDLATSFSMLERSIAVMIGANQNAQIATLSDRDVGIGVQMGDLRTDDFERVPEAIERGRAAALASAESLRRYAVSEREYAAWSLSVGREAPSHAVSDVRIVGLDRVAPEYIRSRLDDIEAGRELSPEAIAADAARIYATGDFERVDYRITGPDDARVLEIHPVEKSWGPDFLSFDVGLATSGGGDLQAVLRADHDRTWVNGGGGAWHNAVQLGRQTQLQTDFYQPLDAAQRFFTQAMAFAQNDLQDIYLLGDRVAQYLVGELYGQVDLGVNVGTRAQMRFGLRRGAVRADLDTGVPGLLPDFPIQADASIHARLVYDTRDSIGLPTRGSFVNARWERSGSALGGEFDYELVEAVYEQAFNFRGDSLSLIVGGAETLDGDLPPSQQLQIGGIRTFPGLKPGELRGDSYRFASARYAWLLREFQPLLGQALYAGVSLQAGRVGNRIDGGPEDTVYGIAGTLGGRTTLGPFLLSLGLVDDDTWELQFTIGRPVEEGSILDELH